MGIFKWFQAKSSSTTTMHPSARKNCQRFFTTYGPKPEAAVSGTFRVGEVGAQDVNGSLRDVCPAGASYVGFDLQVGPNVDLVMPDPYKIPVANDTFDVILSTSCFEHVPMFWLLFQEILRVLKPDGLLYLCAPANGKFHRHPLDCWRFYPDSGLALVEWGKRCGYSPALMESYTSQQDGDAWNDFVAVFLKEDRHAPKHSRRIVDTFNHYDNGIVFGEKMFRQHQALVEDQRHLKLLNKAYQA